MLEVKYGGFTLRGFFFFFFKTVAVSRELTAESVAITADELEKLGAGGGVAGFAPPRSFPVFDLVVDDLSVLAVGGWRLPPEHDALGGKKAKQKYTLAYVEPSV